MQSANLLLPFLWESPFDNIIHVIKTASKYPWDAKVFYLGNFYKSEFVQVLTLTEFKLRIIISFFPVARKVLSPDAQSPELQDRA